MGCFPMLSYCLNPYELSSFYINTVLQNGKLQKDETDMKTIQNIAILKWVNV